MQLCQLARKSLVVSKETALDVGGHQVPEAIRQRYRVRLLDGANDHSNVVVQESRKGEIDDLVYKYVGVSGVDSPRIVDVGYRTDSLLAELAFKKHVLAAGVAGLLLATGGLAYFILRCMVTRPLDHLIRSAAAVEAPPAASRTDRWASLSI